MKRLLSILNPMINVNPALCIFIWERLNDMKLNPCMWLLLAIFLNTPTVQADLIVDITTGSEGAQPIAIIPFGLATGMTPPPQDIHSIITNNLYRSGIFAPLRPEQLPQRPILREDIDFAMWQKIAIPFLVTGQMSGNRAIGYTIEFRLFDVFTQQQLVGYSYDANVGVLRQTAHEISDVLYQTLTGSPGIFSTRIVYVTVERAAKARTYRLFIADADGANPRLMLKSAEPLLSPAWSPNGQRLAYVSLERKKAAIYIQDIRTGQRREVSAYQGLNSAPAWSPDGTRLAMSLSKDGNAEIYVLTLSSGQLRRLTRNTSIDTEPDWSPDGNALVFTSDRSGRPQIYRMSSLGGQVQRLTFTGSYNARPRYSPNGKQLAMVHQTATGFQIALMDLAKGTLDVLTNGRLDESPSFAPNGSMVVYGTGAALAAISIDGRVKQRLAVESGLIVREPAWSPFR